MKDVRHVIDDVERELGYITDLLAIYPTPYRRQRYAQLREDLKALTKKYPGQPPDKETQCPMIPPSKTR
jgi:hypothetical protein